MILINGGDFRLFECIFWEQKIAKKISGYLLDSANIRRIVSLDCGGERAESSIDLGDGIRAIEQSYALKNSGIFEAHREFVDFQFVARGSEVMKVGDFSAFAPINEYDLIKDFQNFVPLKSPSKIALYENALLILTPQDIHAGGFELDSKVVFKSVLKVPTKLLKI